MISDLERIYTHLSIFNSTKYNAGSYDLDKTTYIWKVTLTCDSIDDRLPGLLQLAHLQLSGTRLRRGFAQGLLLGQVDAQANGTHRDGHTRNTGRLKGVEINAM